MFRDRWARHAKEMRKKSRSLKEERREGKFSAPGRKSGRPKQEDEEKTLGSFRTHSGTQCIRRGSGSHELES